MKHISHLLRGRETVKSSAAALACAVLVLSVPTAMPVRAQTFTVLLDFSNTNGAYPNAPLVQGTDGNLYGSTWEGGAFAHGMIYRITPGGMFTAVYNFSGPDGYLPAAGLLLARDGSFYGTTQSGGASNDGTVFRVTPQGSLTSLHSFRGTDGLTPQAALVEAGGKLYGTTTYGGANTSACGSGCGTVFEISLAGALQTVYSFCAQPGCADGDNPVGGLVRDINGDFYGTTYDGGVNHAGTIFRLNAGGLSTLHSFNSTDGATPSSTLAFGADGNLYGTTRGGGANNGGTVFKITPQGALTTLHSFAGYPTDGADPKAGLILATDGNLYGTTDLGGSSRGCPSGCGTVYQISSDGTLAILHSFEDSDGAQPNSGLVQGTDGTFYGAAFGGGNAPPSFNVGTLFSESLGLAPFIKTLPTAGSVGSGVEIFGTNITGATDVTFNGTSAVFHVVSPSLIVTEVPAGATTGPVEVVTPGGTLFSNTAFLVSP